MDKWIIFAGLLLAVARLKVAYSLGPKFLWMQQKLDHFNNSETRKWYMRYIADDKFFKPGGPLFIYVGGEWCISPDRIGEGFFIHDLARQHNGYLFFTEHRFYGQSKPVKDMANENMQYLNADQGMADLAHFIRSVKQKVPGLANSKVILQGCSYSASLVTWFSKMYPDLVNGGWASSATLLAKDELSERQISVGEAIKQLGGVKCYNRIKSAIDKLQSMLANGRSSEVMSLLKICNFFDDKNALDVSSLFYQISQVFGNIVLENRPLADTCSKIMSAPNDLTGLTDFIVDTYNSTPCTEFSYRDYLTIFANTSFSQKIRRAWFYQACNEFGWFDSTSSPKQPFGNKIPFSFFTSLCTDSFGKHFTREYIRNHVRNTNKRFGGRSPGVKNIYWTQGSLDPWSSVGIQSGRMFTFIQNGVHCGDLYSLSSADSPQLQASKQKFAALVEMWLAE